MKLKSIRIRCYKTIGSVEQTLNLSDGLAIIGPNNSGKTNLLEAIEALFTGYENMMDYDQKSDLTFGEKPKKTSLTAIFQGDPEGKDKEIYKRLDELHDLLGTSRNNITDISLNLYFTHTNTPVYQFFPNVQRPKDTSKNAQYSSKNKQLVEMLLSGFVCNYVPSEKGIEELCNYLLIPSLRRLAAEVMSPYMEKVQGMLDEAAEKINKVMKESGLEDIKACFKFPNNSVEELIRGFDFRLLDPMETTIYMKGLGIQSIALLSSFIWITEKEKTQDKEVIWLLEEPESYLHPELFVICEKILEKLREEALVLITSHSINFVPRNHLKVVGTELDNNRTIIKSYKSHQEATESLRKSLGVKFSDYFNLSRYNIFVEGPSDREYLNWIIKILSNKDGLNYQYLFSNQTLIKDFGGVANLAGFLKANYELIRKERAVVSVFDGDDAGRNRTSELQHYFGEKGGFNVNKDYVSMPDGFPIEGLFPDNWIIDCHSQHEGWFERYSVDALGKLQYFTLVDGKRNNFAEKMKEKAEEQPDLKWAEKWEKTCQCINNALRLLEEGLKH